MDFPVAEDVVAIGCAPVVARTGDFALDGVPDLRNQGADAGIDAHDAVIAA
jgi:hypothetical protein